MIEFNDFHVNQNYYGPLRTTVLMMLGYVHDPDGKCGVSLIYVQSDLKMAVVRVYLSCELDVDGFESVFFILRLQ